VSDVAVKVESIERIDDTMESLIATDASPDRIAGEQNIGFKLKDGSSYSFDRKDPRAQLWLRILSGNFRKRAPVYVEAYETLGKVKEIFSPFVRFVKAVRPGTRDDRFEVLFLFAPSAYFLNPSHPEFKTMQARLAAAVKSKEAVLVTLHAVTSEILDVREAPGHARELKSSEGASTEDPDDPRLDGSTVELLAPVIDMARAVAVFKSLRQQPQIPFDFLEDCCFARAHEMCRLMVLEDIQSRKIWNFGHGFMEDEATLQFFSPLGSFTWFYHVAPIVRVRQDGDVFNLVMDPGVSNRPLKICEWLDLQNDHSSTRRFTAAGIYGLDIKTKVVNFDFGFTRTPDELDDHFNRREFRNLNEIFSRLPLEESLNPRTQTNEGDHNQ
jgi:Glutaminase